MDRTGVASETIPQSLFLHVVAGTLLRRSLRIGIPILLLLKSLLRLLPPRGRLLRLERGAAVRAVISALGRHHWRGSASSVQRPWAARQQINANAVRGDVSHLHEWHRDARRRIWWQPTSSDGSSFDFHFCGAIHAVPCSRVEEFGGRGDPKALALWLGEFAELARRPRNRALRHGHFLYARCLTYFLLIYHLSALLR